jgi:hypothetical protein
LAAKAEVLFSGLRKLHTEKRISPTSLRTHSRNPFFRDLNRIRNIQGDKFLVLREAEQRLKSIQTPCQKNNISAVSSHRWKQPFGQMDVHKDRRVNELERETREPKEMRAEALW